MTRRNERSSTAGAEARWIARTSILVYGSGKVGTALARALRAHGVRTELRAARRGLPRAIAADVVVLAVRDRDLEALATAIAAARLLPERAVVLHVAGGLDARALAPLRAVCSAVGQMHPMISFASKRVAPRLERGQVRVQGDRAAVAWASRIARLLGMTPRALPGLDVVAYHAAAGLVANGGAALAAVGAELLHRAGVSRRVAAKMLGPLLRSVADNVEALGFPRALTGPVRRGDAAGVNKHIAALRAKLPDAVGLYVAAACAQLPLARALGEAPPEQFDEIARILATAAPARPD